MQFVGTFWALVPPIVAITLALITKEAYSSLFIGVVIGALFACNFSPIATIDMIVNDGLVTAVADNAGIFLFLVLLGIIVALVNLAGGSAAFGRWAEENIHTRVGAQLATFVLGILIFIDDYFNCLTVGSVMRPVTDRHQISRPKLAYLIDATAAPVCMIAPISSWAAAVSSTAEDLDTGISGIQLFIRAIPYNFYSLLTFVFIITLTLLKFDYGPMRGFEERARNTGDLSGSTDSTEENINPKGRVIDLIIPVILLIIFCTIGMLYVGGFFGADTSGCTDYAGDFIGAFGNTDAFVGLPWGGIIALVLTVVYLVARKVITFQQAMECVPKGFIAMIWAAAAMGVYNLGLQEANAALATATVGVVCKNILGPVGGIIALLGIIVLPITSGDTALRGLRLQISESFHIDQSSKGKRLGLSAVIFALVAVILVFAKFNAQGFAILWRYFAWSNQTLSLFAFLAISVWMFENGKGKWVWMPMIPGAWYTFITITYIMNAKIGFNMPWPVAYGIGIAAAVVYVAIICWYGKKRSSRLANAHL